MIKSKEYTFVELVKSIVFIVLRHLAFPSLPTLKYLHAE